MTKVVLSKRLQALADMVTPGRRVVDVGCDHGFVSIYLVQKKISPGVLAMDVRKGPLSRAQEHIAEYGLGDYIETRLSDGLQAFQMGEADAVVCAGMGGRLMKRILTEGREKAQSLKELILQPQSELPAFRKFLRTEGYRLLDENILVEEGKYYFLMKVRFEGLEGVCGSIGVEGMSEEASEDGSLQQPFGEKDAMGKAAFQEDAERILYDKYGELLLKRRDRVLQEYLQETLRNMHQIEEGLSENANQETERVKQRLAEVKQEIADLEKALSMF